MDEHVLKTIYWCPTGVCAKLFTIDIDGDKIVGVKATGGCSGNLKAIAVLINGMEVKEAISKLKGITCGNRGTSCADQLASALIAGESNC